MSQDRKTRTKGNRVMHTVTGTPYSGDLVERPRGLTTEQGEEQRVGVKLDERQTREAADRVRDTVRPDERASDELVAKPYGRKDSRPT
ncbi:MAG TPA: hypothetical protein VGR02_15075 [Thermoanaerobaculia bacterium]|nr:hypothetical protein [Thermoanaerobaculia bacterium]